MKFFLPFFVFTFLLASCVPARSVAALPNISATATAIVLPASTATFIPALPTATPTKIPCDPRAVDFCITDGHFIFARPISLDDNASVDKSYRYASTANGKREPHHGVDILNEYGTPVYAAADGVVVFAGPDSKAVYSPWINFYGNMIVLKHDHDLYTLYGHLSKIVVQAGETVQVGGKIGEVGQTGVAIGSHLHFEVRTGNIEDYFSTLNPELWLVPEEGDTGVKYGVVMISIVDEKSQHKYAEMTLERMPTASDKGKTFYLDTYVNAMAKGEENAAMGDLLAGRYRIALKYNGHLYERMVEVQSGELTQVVIVVK